jgi:hypothetical protein
LDIDKYLPKSYPKLLPRHWKYYFSFSLLYCLKWSHWLGPWTTSLFEVFNHVIHWCTNLWSIVWVVSLRCSTCVDIPRLLNIWFLFTSSSYVLVSFSLMFPLTCFLFTVGSFYIFSLSFIHFWFIFYIPVSFLFLCVYYIYVPCFFFLCVYWVCFLFVDFFIFIV